MFHRRLSPFALAFVIALLVAPVAGVTAVAPAVSEAPAVSGESGGPVASGASDVSDPGDSATPGSSIPGNDTDRRSSAAADAPTLRASAADGPVINHTYVVDRTPGTRNSVQIRSIVEVPDVLTNITLALPPDASIERTDGFRRLGSNRVAWDEGASTTRPTVTYTVAANRSDGFGLASVETGSYAFVDANLFRGRASWSWRGATPEYAVSATTAGEGIATGEFAYMGAYTTQSYDGTQEFLYVETAPSSPTLPAGSVMRELSDVGGSLDVGERDGRVVVVAPPEILRLGGKAGDASMWVNVDDGFGESDWQAWEVWFHEYVHTRQNISARSGGEMYWLIEASAEYYGGYLAWERGYASDDQFRRFLATDEHADTRLRDAVRGGDDREYKKGRRVVGALDIRIRQATGGERTVADVLRAVNGQEVDSYREFRAIVTDVANDSDGSLGGWLDRQVTTTDAPEIPQDVAAAYDIDDEGGNETSPDGPPPVQGSDAAPTDTDGDGRYEDVNGDGDVTPGDATVLFRAAFAGDPAVTDNVAAFDFNSDGAITPGDATVLFGLAFG